MKMHAKLPTTLRTLLTMGLTMLCASAFADGTKPSVAVTFTGKYVTQSCHHTGSTRQQVTLPTIPTNALTKAGDTAGDTAFTISLACEGGQAPIEVAFISFHRTDGRLNSAGSAQNVQLQLLRADGTPIIVGDESNRPTFPMSSTGTMSLPFIARYYATGATTPGQVSALVWYFILIL